MPTPLRVAFAGVTATLIAVAAAPAQGGSAQPFRALFIGNSYMYVNDLPAVVGDLAAAAHEPRRFEPYVVLVGGSTLEAHITRHVALDEIAKGKWDAVLIQDQSTRPITEPEATLRDVRIFADAARKVGARLVLYETWAREVAPETQDSLTHVYHAAAKSVGQPSLTSVRRGGDSVRRRVKSPAEVTRRCFVPMGVIPLQSGRISRRV